MHARDTNIQKATNRKVRRWSFVSAMQERRTDTGDIEQPELSCFQVQTRNCVSYTNVDIEHWERSTL